jgi:glyoxylase-like metal-dependent hydrolase (beta-lactamase superfamily II)
VVTPRLPPRARSAQLRKNVLVKVGKITIDGVSDGSILAPPTLMFNRPSEEDWIPHQQFLDVDGMLTFEMGGFLIRDGTRTLLVDVGIGPHADPERTGSFMRNLEALGVRPEDVTDVALTHLHFDHVGWASDGERPLFPNATYRCHQADWDFFLGTDPYDESLAVKIMGGRRSSELMPVVRERIEAWHGDGTILPGVNVQGAPGHTPGSTIIIISSGTERAILLGDVVHCPAELLEDDWEMIGDVDRSLAQATRVALAQELEGTNVPMAATHFPGLQFGRLLPGSGMRGWVFE